MSTYEISRKLGAIERLFVRQAAIDLNNSDTHEDVADAIVKLFQAQIDE